MCIHWFCKTCDKYFDNRHCSEYYSYKCANYEDVIDQLCDICSQMRCKINVPVCNQHKICFCEDCRKSYKETGFTTFNNRCIHEDSPCPSVLTSQKYISQMKLISLYNSYRVLIDLRVLIGRAH